MSKRDKAAASSQRASARPPAGAAQEAVGPYPETNPSPDARGSKSRKNPRGPASHDAPLRPRDACGNLPQKKPRTPAPSQGRSRRGRPHPQNRDGSGNPGIAEGSLPRLAPSGQDFEQEILLLRSLANRLLSARTINYPYLFRCLNLILRAATARAIHFNNQSKDELDKMAAGMRRLFESTMADRTLGYRDLLPVLLAKPDEDWTYCQDLLPIHPDLMDSLLHVKQAWEIEHGSPFIHDPSDDEEPPPFGMRPLPPHIYQPPKPFVPEEARPQPPMSTPPAPDFLPQDPPSSFIPIQIGGPGAGETDPFPYPAEPTPPKAPRRARGRLPP